jgi:predicted dehydrogenase
MTQTIGVGVIGMGWMGTVHSRAYLQAADRFYDSGIRAKLLVCADDVEARAREGQERFDFERYTTRWQDVMADPRVQVVNVTTPTHLHLALVKAAAAAGKHIFCEKPVGRNPQETAEIEQLARQAGVLTFVGYNYRWAPLVQYAGQLIREGKLGRLTHFRGRFFAGYAADPDAVLSWRFQRELSGSGVLGDLMSHVIDLGLMLAGGHCRSRHPFQRREGWTAGRCNQRGLRRRSSAIRQRGARHAGSLPCDPGPQVSAGF